MHLQKIYGRAIAEYRQAAMAMRDGAVWDATARREVIRTGEVVNALGDALWAVREAQEAQEMAEAQDMVDPKKLEAELQGCLDLEEMI